MKAEIQTATDREFIHPLRSLPWLRRLPDTMWVAVLLTAAICVLVALAITGFAPNPLGASFGERLQVNLVYGFLMGYSIHFLSYVFVPKIRVWLGDRSFALRLLANLVLWALGTVIGFVIAGTLLGYGPMHAQRLMVLVIMLLALAAITGISLRGQALRELRAEREKNEHIEAQRALAATRLRLLQAQIEPHFLFNTLANVSSLIDADPKRARVMLDQFTLLLRALLDQTRQSVTTLRKELQVAEAYLSVLKIRMGERLSFQIDAPSALIDTDVPAMLLQPIVENAVKHGIEPKMQGGMVRVSAAREGNDVVLAVEDNGVGFVAHSKESIGLGAIRERLAVQFGDAARLEISRRQEQWTRVAIRIPMSLKGLSSNS